MRKKRSNPEDFLDRVVAELLAEESLGTAPTGEPDARRAGRSREGRRARASAGRTEASEPASDLAPSSGTLPSPLTRSSATVPIAGSLAPSERDRPVERDRETRATAWRGHAVAFALGAALSLLGVRLADRDPSAAPAPALRPPVAAPAHPPAPAGPSQPPAEPPVEGPVTPAAAPDGSPNLGDAGPTEAASEPSHREADVATSPASRAPRLDPRPQSSTWPRPVAASSPPIPPKPAPAKPAPTKVADPYAEVDPPSGEPRQPPAAPAPKAPTPADPYAEIGP